MKRPYLVSLAAGLVLSAALTACGGGDDNGQQPEVVASTDVWASVATAVAGADAKVTAIIKSPDADPHSFDPSAADRARISDAKLVVYNGGDYDPFVDKALEGKDTKRVNAFDSRAQPGDKNEHVWYDMPTTAKVATQIADRLAEIDPAHAQGYRDRANAFNGKLGTISTALKHVATQHPKAPVAQTEPIAHYLLTAAGTEDLTSPAFSEAIEQGSDPSAAAVATMRDLLTAKKVKALIYNSQTSDKVSADLKNAASQSGVKVVEVTETLPAGLDYIQWHVRNVEALNKALS